MEGYPYDSPIRSQTTPEGLSRSKHRYRGDLDFAD
jgi:hypothetical protein